MNAADILGIVALAFSGGAGAYVVWYVSRFGVGGGGQGRRARGGTGIAATGRPGELPMSHDPLLAAEVAALRAELASIAATQAMMLQQQSEREGMLLAEMRAVASVMDPKIVESLARIESSVNGTPPAPPGPEPDQDPGPKATDAPPDDAGPGDAPGGPDWRPEADRLYVVPDARETGPEGAPDSGKTIRRG